VALGKRQLNPSTPLKFGLGLILLGVGFAMMIIASRIVASGELAAPTWLVLTYLFHTFGELAISPVGLSATTKLAPKRYLGQMMGIWFVGAALGNLIAGQIAGDFDANNLQAFPGQYWNIVMSVGGAGLIFVVLSRPIRKLMGGVH
jgi:POT family proton-dependent oligopeptide transporter